MSPWLAMGVIWLASALAMTALWAFALRVRNIGYVDVGWAGLMALAALFAGVVGEGSPLVRSLVAVFGSLWGARVCLLLLHRVLNEEEDGRYKALRLAWNGSALRPAIEPMKTIRPLARRSAGRKACVTATCPTRLTSSW